VKHAIIVIVAALPLYLTGKALKRLLPRKKSGAAAVAAIISFTSALDANMVAILVCAGS